MAIKKRTPVESKQLDEAIEQFGNAADTIVEPQPQPQPPAPTPKPAVYKPVSKARVRVSAPSRAEEDQAATMLIRWPDASLPTLLAEVSDADERSKHATALRALRRGLEAMRAEQ